jgi:hypothetical protein
MGFELMPFRLNQIQLGAIGGKKKDTYNLELPMWGHLLLYCRTGMTLSIALHDDVEFVSIGNSCAATSLLIESF